MWMACCRTTPALILASPLTGGKETYVRRSFMPTAAPPQSLSDRNSQENQRLQALDSGHVSRRKSMLYLSAGTLGGLTLLSAGPAEARAGRLENRRKALEKLREKARESGPSTGNKKKERGQSPPASPQEQATGRLVEAKLS